ncbi:MAG: hypothetical protein O7C59_06235 [Rickettsia endosymbiont of Ixodes persulcatus]|nr:hypothetical protein [Rickettsia endosymbiont of Ixodes persulcatus]
MKANFSFKTLPNPDDEYSNSMISYWPTLFFFFFLIKPGEKGEGAIGQPFYFINNNLSLNKVNVIKTN